MNKKRYWDFWQQLGNTHDASSLCRDFFHEDLFWQGPEPLNAVHGRDAFVSTVWQPLSNAFELLQQKPYLLMEGQFEGGDWVSSTGYFTGVFMHDWLGIPATGKAAWLRYGEFSRFVGGKVVESYVIFDIPELMWQAGYTVFPKRLGEDGFAPVPATRDGLLLTAQDPHTSQNSLALVESMIFSGLNSFDNNNLESMGQERFWHSDMDWYGPHGIGRTYGLEGFKKYHQKPFLDAFPDRKGGNHKARFADGHYVASTGWPSLQATHSADYLGAPATGKRISLRVMDWWRAEAGLLAENWVLLDFVDLFKQFDIDLFACLTPDQPREVNPDTHYLV